MKNMDLYERLALAHDEAYQKFHEQLSLSTTLCELGRALTSAVEEEDILRRIVPILSEQIDIMWFGNNLTDHNNLKIVKGDTRDTDQIPMEGVEAIIHLANIANDPCGELNSKLSWEVNVLATMGLVGVSLGRELRALV